MVPPRCGAHSTPAPHTSATMWCSDIGSSSSNTCAAYPLQIHVSKDIVKVRLVGSGGGVKRTLGSESAKQTQQTFPENHHVQTQTQMTQLSVVTRGSNEPKQKRQKCTARTPSLMQLASVTLAPQNVSSVNRLSRRQLVHGWWRSH